MNERRKDAPEPGSRDRGPARRGRLANHLGPALRHLRLHGGSEPRKQLDVAAAAGVTRGMLSSYERGKQDPSLRNLDRILRGLDADLVQLQWALRIVQAHPDPGTDAEAEGGAPGSPPPSGPRSPTGAPIDPEVREAPAPYRTVPVPEPLRPEEERALGQMIAGFLAYVRYTREQGDLGRDENEPGEAPEGS